MAFVPQALAQPADSLPIGALLRLGQPTMQHPGPIVGLAITPDGKVGIVAGKGEVRFWDLVSGRVVARWDCLDVSALSLSPDGKLLAAGTVQGAVRLWDMARGQPLHDWQAVGKTNVAIRALAFSPDSKRLAVGVSRDAPKGPDPIVRIWDVSAPTQAKVIQALNGEAWGAFAVAFHPEGKTLATAEWVEADREKGKGAVNPPLADPSTICLWDLETGKIRKRLSGLSGWGLSLSYSSDGTLLAVASDHRTMVWDAATGERKHLLYSGAKAVAFAPRGERLLTGGLLTAVRNLATLDAKADQELAFGKERHDRDPKDMASRVAFAANGTRYLTANATGQVRVWDAATGQEQSFQASHLGRVATVAYSPDGRLIASGGLANTLQLWDAASGYQAQWTLRAQPAKTIAYLKQNLQVVPVEKGKRIEELLAKLGDPAFAERARADAALRQEGRLAVPVLRAALTREWPVETMRRIETLLRNLEAEPLSGAELRQVRAVAVLEALGEPDAEALLQSLANGSPLARLTQEAQSALRRRGR
ncbi:MAG TPA: hypothetical protein VEL76_28765 [Gemmataceae bacterium]|nr:hypothetical protein [Gemmataceae bacterium]